MGRNFSDKLKHKNIAYGGMLMGGGILLHLAMEEFNLFDEELLGFFTGLFFGAGIAITLSVFIKIERRTRDIYVKNNSSHAPQNETRLKNYLRNT